jgi:hypothetical protein
MPLPTLSKTWQHNVNQVIPAQGSNLATNRRNFKLLKDSLIGFGTLPWTTRGSSNSTTAGMDAVDRWATDADLVWGGGVHSWYVFRQTGIATNFEMCLDLNSSSPYIGTLAVSPSVGFTGGSTSARPTATDEIVLINNNVLGGAYNGDVDTKLHVMQSTDGQCTRVMFWAQNGNTTFYLFDKPNNPVSGWTNPSVSIAIAGGLGGAVVASLGNLLTAANGRGRGTSTMNLYLTAEGIGSSGNLMDLLTQVNDFDSNAPFFPIGLLSLTTSHRGRHGSLFDLWYGMTIIANSDTYPNDASRQFAQLGDLILPWNGSVPLIT